MKKFFHLFQKRRPAATASTSEPATRNSTGASKNTTDKGGHTAQASRPGAPTDKTVVLPPPEIYADDGDLGYC